VKPRVGLAGAGRVKDPAAAGKATAKAGALGGKGKAAVVVSGGTATVAGVEGVKSGGEVKTEDEREVAVERGQVISIEVSPEEPHDASQDHHEGHMEVPMNDVSSHEDGESVLASPILEGEEIHYAEGSVREDNVTSPPPVSSSDHGHEPEPEHPGEEEHGSPQLSEDQQAELLKDDVSDLPEPSENEVAEAAAHPGAEEHLEKVVPPYQPSVLPTGEQVDEEKWKRVERIPDDA
jgi:hypothetical protein